LDHLLSQEEGQYSEQGGVEVEVEVGDPNLGPDPGVVVVEGFVLVGEGCHLASHAVEDRVGSHSRRRSQGEVEVGVVKHYAHAEQLLFAFLALTPSSVVAFGDRSI